MARMVGFALGSATVVLFVAVMLYDVFVKGRRVDSEGSV